MVRMSDVVRGIVRDKPADAAKDAPAPATPPQSPPPPPPPPRPPVTEVPRPAPRAEQPREVESAASLDTLPLEHGTPAESAEPLFAELQLFLARVRELIRTGDEFPWPELERIIDRCAASLVISNELFWLASNTTAVAGVDYLAFHQARVGVLAMTIGASVGYDRQ